MRECVLEVIILKVSIDEKEVKLGREWLPEPDKKNSTGYEWGKEQHGKSSSDKKKYIASEELSVDVTLSGHGVIGKRGRKRYNAGN